jgi:cytochrome c-type biogenesis protein CcmF
MGLAPSPDIKRNLTRDIYAHVDKRSTRENIEWSKPEELKVTPNHEFFANDYVATLESMRRVYSVEGIQLDSTYLAVAATIRVKGEKQDYIVEPAYIIDKDRLVLRPPSEIRDLGLQFTLTHIDPQANQVTLAIETRQKDWIVIRALEKPFINVLWLGTFVVMVGFVIAIKRRYSEFKKMKAKGME